MDVTEYTLEKKQLDFSRLTLNDPLTKFLKITSKFNLMKVTDDDERKSSFADDQDSRDTDTSLMSAFKSTIHLSGLFLIEVVTNDDRSALEKKLLHKTYKRAMVSLTTCDFQSLTQFHQVFWLKEEFWKRSRKVLKDSEEIFEVYEEFQKFSILR